MQDTVSLRRASSVLLIIAALFFRTVISVHFRGAVLTRFNYDDEDNTYGINHWNDIDTTCETGRSQSPINIDIRSAHRGRFKKPLKIRSTNTTITEVKVENSGTTAEFNFKFRGDKPEISDGPLSDTYVFDALHYHWGILDNEGSEHTLNGRSYSMEAHYVFYNKKYLSEANAGLYPDGFVVLALLFDVSSRTKKLGLWDLVDHIVYEEEQKTIWNPKLTFQDLIPENFIYAHYRGSFTTPPCMENVDWIVSLDINDIHSNQIKNFRNMVSENKNPIADNFRPLQHVNNRRIQIGSKLKDDEQSGNGISDYGYGSNGQRDHNRGSSSSFGSNSGSNSFGSNSFSGFGSSGSSGSNSFGDRDDSDFIFDGPSSFNSGRGSNSDSRRPSFFSFN